MPPKTPPPTPPQRGGEFPLSFGEGAGGEVKNAMTELIF